LVPKFRFALHVSHAAVSKATLNFSLWCSPLNHESNSTQMTIPLNMTKLNLNEIWPNALPLQDGRVGTPWEPSQPKINLSWPLYPSANVVFFTTITPFALSRPCSLQKENA
jgi:hypothetical protein